MQFLRKAFGKKIVQKSLDHGHQPAEILEKEEERLLDLKTLQLVEKKLEKDKRFLSFPKLASLFSDCELAQEMINFVKGLNFQQQGLGNDSWYIRIGVHIRPLIAGEATHQFNIWGDTVNMASRMESSGEQMIVHFSKDTKMQVPESLKFLKRENVSVKDKGLLSTDVLEN